MTLEITVRGAAEQRFAAERATVTMAAALEGTDKQQVYDDAVTVLDPLVQQLRGLADRGAVSTWSNDQVRVYSHRPWIGEGVRGELQHVARVQLAAEFTDFERLSGFVDYWAGKDGVEIAGIAWDVTMRNRRTYESDVRKAAVDNAITKAQAYADAVRRGRVTALQFADPGMLNGGGDQSPTPVFMRMTGSDEGAAELDLTPDEIVIQVEVDAHFVAD
ncbi:MAG: SIMPL domain-containing protein [Aeromicrobium sp.]